MMLYVPRHPIALYNMQASPPRRLRRNTGDRDEHGGPMTELDPPYGMLRWLEMVVFPDAKIQARADGEKRPTPNGARMARMLARLRRRLRAAQGGTWTAVDDGDHEVVLDVLNKPGSPWNMEQASQFEPYIVCWENPLSESDYRARLEAGTLLPPPMLEEPESED